MMMKPFRAWAIVHMTGGIVLFDHRVPVYWKRGIANNEALDKGFIPARLVRVEVREVKRKKGKAGK